MKRNDADFDAGRPSPESLAESSGKVNLEDPRLVMTLLEADQVVAAKRQSRFGPRKLSFGVRVMLWGLRAYVVVMLVLVVVSVVRAIHPAP